MKQFVLTMIVLAMPVLLIGQTLSGDSLLASERSIDRPVTVHARQIRVSAGYGISAISKRFDNESKSVDLDDQGLASTRHRFDIDIKYGIIEFIQLNVATGYASKVVREPTQHINPLPPEPAISQNVVHRYKGIEDLYVGVDLRAPLSTRRFDLALTLGASLPVANSDPKRPEHRLEVVQANGSEIHNFEYSYYHPAGNGVTVGRIGGIAKYRADRWAVSARLDYEHGLEEGSGYEWRHQLNDGSFEYRKQPVTYRLPDANTYYVEGEYQPNRWLDVFLIFSGYTSFDGWASRQDEVKVATYYQTTSTISPGVEILATPRLWVRGKTTFPLTGKNIEAPFTFQATVMYNFFLPGS